MIGELPILVLGGRSDRRALSPIPDSRVATRQHASRRLVPSLAWRHASHATSLRVPPARTLRTAAVAPDEAPQLGASCGVRGIRGACGAGYRCGRISKSRPSRFPTGTNDGNHTDACDHANFACRANVDANLDDAILSDGLSRRCCLRQRERRRTCASGD